ncbi:DUF5116 domain-containing protein [Pelobium manganitolerans]|uniref:DUF5116 domain-containing protein n=1 Tax=Pelobium manganitolerans TaxID=1842495 RepID=A0A419S9Q0_9SPHI|nr:SusF/SusE family outer membrane protein [Pelobium manganitolerans]RKD18608.1 DUF5116 domain-containing protein [Pelobium manganitolerans]
MKTIDKIFIALLFLFPFILFSCKKDLSETFKDTGEQKLALSADVDSLTLDVSNPTGKAVKFSWTRGSNQGTNAGITYQFQLALAGTNFQNSFSVDLEKGTNTLEYTHEELNAILTEDISLNFDTEADLEARIIATVAVEGMEPQVSETLNLFAKTYKPIAKTLFLIGPATAGGWSADDATPMNVVAGTAGGFTWQGKLNAGELKFITTLGQFLPSYTKGDNDQQLYLRETDSQPDDKFNIPATGVYQITLNIITKVISIEAKDAPQYGQLWFVGGFTGWNFEPMENDMLDPFVFHFNAELNSSNATDEFKIATVGNSFDGDKVFLRPAVNGQGAGTNLDVVKLSGDENPEDNKWKIAPGVYKIKLDLRTMKIDIVKYNPFPVIYLVGGATSIGWDIANALPMTALSGNPYKFTWTGPLGTDELKFTCDKKTDWSGAFFLASTANKQPSGTVEPMVYSPAGSGTDYKWKISSAGTYTIELDQLQETVKITKQ